MMLLSAYAYMGMVYFGLYKYSHLMLMDVYSCGRRPWLRPRTWKVQCAR
jgi:hypothetical protein